MDKTFVRVYSLFILFFVGIGLLMIYKAPPSHKTDRAEQGTAHTLGEVSQSPLENPMIPIPAGEFIMGAEDGGMDEQPQRNVYLDAFAIQKYEVMQHEYNAFVEGTGHRKPLNRYVKNIEYFNHVNQPAIYVSWLDAYDYCAWRGFRLPTEAEWEKAARGTEGLSWPWREKFEASFANFKGDSDQGVFTMVAGSYKKDESPYGIYDMSGNVREWVQDWYNDQYYLSAPIKNPLGPQTGEEKVLRGSSWRDSLYAGRASGRLKMTPGYRYEGVGFRCAQTVNVDMEER
ncbi:MAG: formylglycine-generating enzyme family protein [Nitrospirae bacterium]|nr:formylglycine-generating enzyme family protein [Candidatus Manganitrophaceae bacterium]